jgi:hypothetical protein
MKNDNDNPQEIEQDFREQLREDYNEHMKAEEAENVEVDESPEVDEKPIDDIEPKEQEQPETPETAEVEDNPPVELPELTPNDLWPEDFKEKFPELPRDAQQFLIDTHRQMQTGLHQKFTEIAGYRKEQEELEQDFQRIDGFLQHNGIPRQKVLKDSIRHIANIVQDPYPGARLFLKEMGVDINKLVEEEKWVDPEVQKANQQTQALQQQLAQMQQMQQNQLEQQAKAQLDAFINEANEQGHLKHPRYEELRPIMHTFYQQDMQSGQPERPLPEYYAMAERFTAAQAGTPTPDPQQIQEPKTNAVQKAKVASKNIKSKTSTKSPADMDLRDELRAGLKQMGV